jgi:hypothetical protein
MNPYLGVLWLPDTRFCTPVLNLGALVLGSHGTTTMYVPGYTASTSPPLSLTGGPLVWWIVA